MSYETITKPQKTQKVGPITAEKWKYKTTTKIHKTSENRF